MNGADQFAYLIVMPGVVAALALGRLLRGLALGFVRPGVIGHWIPSVWAVILFTMQVQYWHTTRLCAGAKVDNLLIYCTFFVMPVMVYLASTVLMPVNDSPPHGGPRADFDLRKHYLRHASAFFWICCLGLLLEIVMDLSVSLPCKEYGTRYDNSFRGVGACLALGLAYFKADRYERLHRAGAVLGAALLGVFICIRMWLDLSQN